MGQAGKHTGLGRSATKTSASSRNSSSARRVSGEAIPQCLKLPIRAYDLSQALAIKIRFQALADVSENDRDSVLCQILNQLFESASRRVVNARDRSRVHDKPAQGGGRFGRQFAHLGGEAINVCIEEIGPEPIHQQPRRRHPAWFHSAHLPIAVGCLRFHRHRRLVVGGDKAYYRYKQLAIQQYQIEAAYSNMLAEEDKVWSVNYD